MIPSRPAEAPSGDQIPDLRAHTDPPRQPHIRAAPDGEHPVGSVTILRSRLAGLGKRSGAAGAVCPVG